MIRFGTFEVYDRADKTRNPHTREEIQIAASKFSAFKPDKEKWRLNEKVVLRKKILWDEIFSRVFFAL
ncbi:HU family DNA-binding protein [Peribacillus simplex]